MSLCVFVCLPVCVPANFLFVVPCVHTCALQICAFPSFCLSVIPGATGPQRGAAYSLPFPMVTIAFCHPSDGMSLPLSCEACPSWGDKLSPSASRHLSSHTPGSCPPLLFLTFFDAPSTRLRTLSATCPSGKTREWKQGSAG